MFPQQVSPGHHILHIHITKEGLEKGKAQVRVQLGFAKCMKHACSLMYSQ